MTELRRHITGLCIRITHYLMFEGAYAVHGVHVLLHAFNVPHH